MNKLSNTETELEKSVPYKKACIRPMNFSVISCRNCPLEFRITFKYLVSLTLLLILSKDIEINQRLIEQAATGAFD